MEWGERQADGSVIVYNDEGRPPRRESWEQNQGIPPAPTPVTSPVSRGGYYGAPTTPYVGGTGQLAGYDSQAQLAMALKQLAELEIPGMRLDIANSLANQTGYINPNLWGAITSAWDGGGTSGTAGTYQTVHGPRTIAEMEAELKAAGWPGGEDVPTAYARTTGGAVTPAAGATGGGTTSAGGSVRQQMIDWDLNYRKTHNGQGASKNEWAGYLSLISGLTPEQAGAMYDKNTSWGKSTYKGPGDKPNLSDWYASDDQWSTWQGQIAPQNTLARDIFNQQTKQFDATLAQQNQQYWGNLLGSKSGPRDYWVANALQANMPENVKWGDMKSLVNATPSFGAMTPSDSWESTFMDWVKRQKTGDKLPGDTGGPSPSGGTQPTPGGDMIPRGGQVFDRSVSDYRGTVGPGQRPDTMPVSGGDGNYRLGVIDWQAMQKGYPQQGSVFAQASNPDTRGVVPPPISGRPSYVPDDRNQVPPPVSGRPGDATDWRGTLWQPNQITPRDYRAMTPSQREMQAGQFSAYGIDPNDAWDKMRKSWNTGGGGAGGNRRAWRY